MWKSAFDYLQKKTPAELVRCRSEIEYTDELGSYLGKNI